MASAELEAAAEPFPFAEMIMIKRAKNKKRIAKPKVSQLTTFSEPRSLVFAKTLRPPPVMAPEAPSDLPP